MPQGSIMTTQIGSFVVETVSGSKVEITLSTTEPCDGRLLTAASVQVQGKLVKEWLDGVHDIPPRSDMPLYAKLRALGATHYAQVGGGTLALGAIAAETIRRQMADASAHARQIREAEDAARCAEIRAAQDVRRVLRHSPAWPDQYGLSEAYPADPASEYASFVKFRLPGCADVPVDPRCPSLADIKTRSVVWGAYPGHENTLWLVSDADWEILVAETADQALEDKARETARAKADAAGLADLRAIEIPAQAVAAFRRFGGDFDAAWESEDETAASLIRSYGAAIEAQGIAFRRITTQKMPIEPPGA